MSPYEPTLAVHAALPIYSSPGGRPSIRVVRMGRMNDVGGATTVTGGKEMGGTDAQVRLRGHADAGRRVDPGCGFVDLVTPAAAGAGTARGGGAAAAVAGAGGAQCFRRALAAGARRSRGAAAAGDRKSTRLNSSH